MANVNTDEIQNIVRAGAASIIEYRTQVKNFIEVSLANFAEGEDLDLVGRSRNLPRLNGESDESFRIRIINAWEANKGLGNVDSIIAIIEGLGYVFNSFVQGDTRKGTGSFNLIVRSLGSKLFDGSWIFDGSILFNTPPANGMTIEIVQDTPVSEDQEKQINSALSSVIRASQSIPQYSNI